MVSDKASASALLWRHWQEGEVLDELPPDLMPETRAEGYAIQAFLERYSSQPRVGWKIAATSTAGQKHINVDGPLAGRLLVERLHEDGARVSIKGNRMRVCEPEFAFRLAEDVPPRKAPYSVAEAMAKVADLHLTIELPDSRFADFTRVGGPSLIADNACGGDLVVGARVVADWRDIDLAAQKVVGRVVGRYEREGAGASVLGSPAIALTWLVNEVSALGIGIRRGELVTTGTCMTPLEVEEGDRVEMEYGDLGSIGLSIADDG